MSTIDAVIAPAQVGEPIRAELFERLEQPGRYGYDPCSTNPQGYSRQSMATRTVSKAEAIIAGRPLGETFVLSLERAFELGKKTNALVFDGMQARS